jgi:GT2 family glycosyltransferase
MSDKTYIILLNWNGLEDTKECIFSLRSMAEPTVSYQIVVVDNASSNNEGQVLKDYFPDIVLIQNERNEGFAGGNNIGIRYALDREDCISILILNNDTTVTENCLSLLQSYLTRNPKSIVGPKILRFDRRDAIQTLGGKIFWGGTANVGKNKKSSQYTKNINPDCISGACFLASKDAFEEIGLFDEDFFAYGEDVDWSIRARQKGYEIITLMDSVIYHKHSQSTKGSPIKAYFITRNNIYFAKKHYRGLPRLIFIINSIALGFFIHAINFRSFFFVKDYLKGIYDGLRADLKPYSGD